MKTILTSNKNILAFLLLLLITIIQYINVITYGFVLYDDDIYLNNLYHNVSTFSNAIEWAFYSTVNSNWSPTTLLSLALDYKLYGLNPYGYHITNIIFHYFSSVAIYLIFLSILKNKKYSFLIALVFLIHPINVETVVWISERKGITAAFFMLFSTFFYLKHQSHNNNKFYILSLIFFSLSLLSKGVYVSLPIVFLLLSWYKNITVDIKITLLKNIKELSPFLLLSLLSGIITIYVHTKSGAIISGEINPIITRLENAINSYVFYLRQAFYPFNLAAHYRYKEILPHITFINIVIIICIIFAAAKNIKKRPYLFFGIAWYSIFLLPTIGIIQTGYHAHADRYAYIPLIGIYAIIILAAADILQTINLNVVLVKVFSISFITILMIITWNQQAVWSSSLHLFERIYEIDNDNYVANTNLARLYIRNKEIDKGLFYYKQAKKMAPYYIDMYDTISYELLHIGELELAISVLNNLIEYDKNYVLAYIKIAQIKISQKKFSEAMIFLDQAKKLSPENIKIKSLIKSVITTSE